VGFRRELGRASWGEEKDVAQKEKGESICKKKVPIGGKNCRVPLQLPGHSKAERKRTTRNWNYEPDLLPRGDTC